MLTIFSFSVARSGTATFRSSANLSDANVAYTFAKINYARTLSIRLRPNHLIRERVCDVRIERFAEDRKVAVPLRATEKANMVSIHLFVSARQLLVERSSEEFKGASLEMRYRLIQEVITEHGRLIAIVRRQPHAR